MSRTRTPARRHAVPLAIATTPRDGETRTDRWWVATGPEGDESLVFFIGEGMSYPTAQCNTDSRVPDRLLDYHREDYPDARTVFVPVAYLGADGICGEHTAALTPPWLPQEDPS